jgi:hypothetical protein
VAEAAEAGGGVGTGELVSGQPAAFFVAEHKLAIALPALRSLYGTAMTCVQASLPTPLRQRSPEVTDGNFPPVLRRRTVSPALSSATAGSVHSCGPSGWSHRGR